METHIFKCMSQGATTKTSVWYMRSFHGFSQNMVCLLCIVRSVIILESISRVCLFSYFVWVDLFVYIPAPQMKTNIEDGKGMEG